MNGLNHQHEELMHDDTLHARLFMLESAIAAQQAHIEALKDCVVLLSERLVHEDAVKTKLGRK
jgi:uncharacterized coiled-coil protein SlyX